MPTPGGALSHHRKHGHRRSERPAAIGPYSHGVVAGGLLFCSGQLPLDPDTGELVEGSIGDQARALPGQPRRDLHVRGRRPGRRCALHRLPDRHGRLRRRQRGLRRVLPRPTRRRASRTPSPPCRRVRRSRSTRSSRCRTERWAPTQARRHGLRRAGDRAEDPARARGRRPRRPRARRCSSRGRSPSAPGSGSRVVLKAENLQRTGSFKLRGATAKLAALGDEAARGVIAGSAGNHAWALALAARERGVPCEVVMPPDAPLAKIAGCRSLGAHGRRGRSDSRGLRRRSRASARRRAAWCSSTRSTTPT